MIICLSDFRTNAFDIDLYVLLFFYELNAPKPLVYSRMTLNYYHLKQSNVTELFL